MHALFQLALISIAFGVPVGALLLPTHWEGKARQSPPPWLPFGHRSLPAIVLGGFVKVALGLTIFLGAPYVALEYFGLLPLRGDGYRIFFIGYFLSLGTGKLLRYGYWRVALRGRLL